MKFLSGILFVIVFMNTLLLAFAFRDFSYPLSSMFLFSVIGFPLATYLFFNREKEGNIIELEDSSDVVGKFSI
jgi:hypothetical protein